MNVPTAILGLVVGALAGYGWYRLVGCPTGGCPITSNPWISTAVGALLGWSIGAGH
jgi:hypothetical protein